MFGIPLGLGAYAMKYAEGLSYFSADPTACMNCHIMEPQFDSWQKSSHHAVATCVDCHLPHKVRKEIVSLTLSDRDCMECHGEPDIHKTVEGETVSLTVDEAAIKNSVHENIPCVKCHSDVDPRRKRPCPGSTR